MSVYAQTSEDTILIQGRDIPEVSIIAKVEQPADTRKKLSNEQLNRENTGQNLPFLLQNTPSFLATSDDGLGIGYTYFRVRGTDHTRINMTVNDVPLNDAESQTVFWVNMTDMASSLTNLTLQRGVGTSTNGASSFGASLNMSTLPTQKMLNDSARAHVRLQFNGGMYNTFREMVSAQVQFPRNWRIEARLSKVNSDGYLYRAKSDLFSYYGSVGYYGKATNITFSAFGGMETTYMAWDGVTAENLLTDRRYNPAGEYTNANGDIAYYPRQNDNYKQQHFQINGVFIGGFGCVRTEPGLKNNGFALYGADGNIGISDIHRKDHVSSSKSAPVRIRQSLITPFSSSSHPAVPPYPALPGFMTRRPSSS